MRILIVGCGYVGQQVAALLRGDGHEVDGWVATSESVPAVSETGANPIVADAADPAAWAGRNGPWDAIVFSVSTSGGGEEHYRRVHGEALRLALGAAVGKPFIYTSSTSVYGQADGSWVDEESLAEPTVATSRVLLAAEREVLSAGGLVLRLSGIYGPGRAIYLRKLIEGTAVMDGGEGRWINQVHRDDAAAAIVWALLHGRSREILNVTDDEPVRLGELYRWLCGQMRLPMPLEVPGVTGRKRGRTHKRVSNARIAAAGWRPIYPTFREGYGALLASKAGWNSIDR